MNLNQRIEQWLNQTRTAFDGSSAASQRPFVTLCYAQSLDGSITSRAGEKLQLSGPNSSKITHQLRSLHDGILVGIGTVLSDDPQLTVREWTGANPQPIVLDSQLRMPASARLCTASGKRCWVLSSKSADDTARDYELLTVTSSATGQVDLPAALQLLYRRGIRSLMVEGGGSVITAFLQHQLADALVMTVAPLIVGGYKAVGELGLSSSHAFPSLLPAHSEKLGDDMIVWGALNFAAGGR